MPPPFFHLLPQLKYLGVFVFSRALLKCHDNFQYQLTIEDDINKCECIFGDQICKQHCSRVQQMIDKRIEKKATIQNK